MLLKQHKNIKKMNMKINNLFIFFSIKDNFILGFLLFIIILLLLPM